MSPEKASSTTVRSCAMNCTGRVSDRLLPVRTCCTSMPRENLPEQMRKNAIRSRCCGSMFAWILNTKAEKSGRVGGRAARSRSCGSAAAAPGRRSNRGTARRRSCSSRCRRRPGSPAGAEQLGVEGVARGFHQLPARPGCGPGRLAPMVSSSSSSSQPASRMGTRRWPPRSTRSKTSRRFELAIVDAAEGFARSPPASWPGCTARRARSRSRPSARTDPCPRGPSC